MPNCDFYAVDGDFAPILDFLFLHPGWILIELASRHDEPLRRFRSTAEVFAAFDLDHENAHLMLYAPETGGSIRERQVLFKPGAVPGAIGRTDSEGWGLIQLYLQPGSVERVGLSHTNCNSESRARAWEAALSGRLGLVNDWDMGEVNRVSERLNRQIRRLGVRKEGSRSVLPFAAQRVAGGATLAPF
jgi:hypothetical protein